MRGKSEEARLALKNTGTGDAYGTASGIVNIWKEAETLLMKALAQSGKTSLVVRLILAEGASLCETRVSICAVRDFSKPCRVFYLEFVFQNVEGHLYHLVRKHSQNSVVERHSKEVVRGLTLERV